MNKLNLDKDKSYQSWFDRSIWFEVPSDSYWKYLDSELRSTVESLRLEHEMNWWMFRMYGPSKIDQGRFRVSFTTDAPEKVARTALATGLERFGGSLVDSDILFDLDFYKKAMGGWNGLLIHADFHAVSS